LVRALQPASPIVSAGEVQIGQSIKAKKLKPVADFCRWGHWLGHKDTEMLTAHYAHLIEYEESPGLSFLPIEVSDTLGTANKTANEAQK
jgi:hypothetical protein